MHGRAPQTHDTTIGTSGPQTASHAGEAIRARSYDVFVSYKRQNADVRDVLLAALDAAHLDPWYDAKLQSGNFRDQLRGKINQSSVTIAIWSREAAAEPAEVMAEINHAVGLKRLIGIRIDDAAIPKQVGEENFLPFDGWRDEARRAEQLAVIIAEAKRLGANPKLRIVDTSLHETTLRHPVELGGIPQAPSRLVGREKELQILREAWASQAPDKVNAVVLHALGGAGKSALVRTFVNEVLGKGGDGAARVYGWSAYSQGAGEHRGSGDADSFIARALTDFGYAGETITDAVERARTLARLVQQERVLLVLDGLEPLQGPPGVDKGRFKDKGFAALVKALGNANPGLVVLTSRQEVPELEGAGPLVVHHPLDELSPRAGADLLEDLGVTGRQRDLEAAVTDLEGHALSVTLLGTYLAEVCGGDILRRDQFNFADVVLSPEEASELATDKTVKPAKRAAKVMRGYLEQFDKLAADGAAKGQGGPERALLHLLGLFDRPADGAAIDALLAKPIPGLTDDLFVEPVHKSKWLGFKTWTELRDLTPAERTARIRDAKGRLRKLRLLAKPNPADPHELDAHPVVRAFFAGRLAETAPEAAKAAHDILYRHYCAAAPDQPDTLDEMKPLFHAIGHGVKAGHVQEAFEEIYHRRMNRENYAFISFKLHAYSADLAALAPFFEKPWSKVIDGLGEDDTSFLLGGAGTILASLGRFKEAIAAKSALIPLHPAAERWNAAISDALSLANIYYCLGDLPQALQLARDAMNYFANIEGEADLQIKSYLIDNLAMMLFETGETQAAINEYEIHGGQDFFALGHLYSILCIENGHYAESHRLASMLLEFLTTRAPTADGMKISLDLLYQQSMWRNQLAQSLEHSDIEAASAAFDLAVEEARGSGIFHAPASPLLARVAHRRKRIAAGERGLLEAVFADLAEVSDIAGDEMRLHLTDLALECARLALDAPWIMDDAQGEAIRQTARAEELINETGYHRRDGQLAELKARLAAMA